MPPIACRRGDLYIRPLSREDVELGYRQGLAMMRALTVLTVVMGIAIVVALALVAYGIMRGTGPDGGAGFGQRDLGLAPGCEIAESRLDDKRLVIRTTGLVEAGCHQVFVLDLDTGQVLGRITAQPASP